MLNSEIVLRDAYRLLCVFLAEQPLYDLTSESEKVWGGAKTSKEQLFLMRCEFGNDEVTHGLINLAICNRTNMEWKKKQHERDWPEKDCGLLTKNLKSPNDVVSLTFREACNKIVHADEVVATYVKDGKTRAFHGEMEPMGPEIWLLGQYGQNEWTAKLNVLQFLKATYDNFDQSKI